MNDSPIPLFLGCLTAVAIGIFSGLWLFAVVPGIILFGLIVVYLQDQAEKQDRPEKK
jgi:hypothetical protein